MSSPKTPSLFIELHVIQSFAPANLNRDDTGSPKDCQFGGYRRARISSQSFKYAMRHHPIFATTTGVELGKRTQRMAAELCDHYFMDKNPEEAMKIARAFAEEYAGKMDKGDKTNVLVYLSLEEFQLIAQKLILHWTSLLTEIAEKEKAKKDKDKDKGKDKKTLLSQLAAELVKETANRTSAPDIALFGRMLADDPKTNIDAACQVAHAISTHRITMEWDYFTAVDDLQPKEKQGAGMIGYMGFNSACYYRYARLDWNQLLDNLKDNHLARQTVKAFLSAIHEATPIGKQNSYAAHTPPNLVLAVVRQDGKSWNLINAFETPIRAERTDDPEQTDNGYINPSIQALEQQWQHLRSFYDNAHISAIAVCADQRHQNNLSLLQSYLKPTLSTWLQTVLDALPQE